MYAVTIGYTIFNLGENLPLTSGPALGMIEVFGRTGPPILGEAAIFQTALYLLTYFPPQ